MNSTPIPGNVQGRDICQSQSSMPYDPQNPSFQSQISTNEGAVESHSPFLEERLLRVSINENAAEYRSQSLTEKLLRVNPSYDTQGNQPCPDPHLDVMREIFSWTTDISEDSQCVYWLSGETGVGEHATSIATSITQLCVPCHNLDALFSVNQNGVVTTEPRVLLSNILRELQDPLPRVPIVMQRFLSDKPFDIDNCSEDMAALLYSVTAVKTVAAMHPSRASLFVINTSGETDARRLQDFAKMLSEMVHDLPRNSKLFVLSRGENAITKAFEPLRRLRRVKSRFLASKQSIEEISQFMEMKLRAILRNCEMAQMGWDSQGDNRMAELSSRASGLYIWAETALKFLQVEFENSGDAAHVEGLWDIFTDINMDDMNTLYLTILRRTCKPGDWEYHYFHRIIGAILVRQAPLSIDDFKGLLHLKNRGTTSHLNVLDFVHQYRALLVNNTSDISQFTIPKLHRHFSRFITSEWAQEFRIYKSAAHGELAIRCIHRLEHMFDYLMCVFDDDSEANFPAQLWYASQCWQSHLTRMVQPDMHDDTGDESQDDYGTPDIPKGNDLQAFPAESLEDSKLTRDSGTDLCSAAFSHNGTQISSSHLDGKVIHIWDGKTGLKRVSLIGHEDGVESVIFSPDDTKLVSASRDYTARVWDTRTGRELLVLRGHVGWVNYAAFSHDGEKVVTCSNDQTLRSWNAQTGEQLNEFRDHLQAVKYFVISPDDQRIASVSSDDVLRVWEFNSGNLISQMQLEQDDDDYGPSTISFCPDINHIISPRSVKGITLWDLRWGTRLSDAYVSAFVPLDFVWNPQPRLKKDSDQDMDQDTDERAAVRGFTYGYITVPKADQHLDHRSPQLFTFKMDRGTIYGILEHGQGIWGYDCRIHLFPKIQFVAGATTMR